MHNTLLPLPLLQRRAFRCRCGSGRQDAPLSLPPPRHGIPGSTHSLATEGHANRWQPQVKQ